MAAPRHGRDISMIMRAWETKRLVTSIIFVAASGGTKGIPKVHKKLSKWSHPTVYTHLKQTKQQQK